MRNRLLDEQLSRFQNELYRMLGAGWRDDLDILWDLREKIQLFERVSSNTAGQHQLLRNQYREERSFTSYLLISMKNIHDRLESELRVTKG